MGNEHSKSKEQLNKNGVIPEKCKNGSANGVSANVSPNGMEIAGCEPADAPVISEIVETIIQKEERKESNEDQTDVGLPAADPQTETADLKPESLTEPEIVTLDSGPEGEKADNGNSQPEENREEENTVMNFFKTIVTSKITKKETATPVATKDQSQKENQPATTTTVAQVSEPPAASKGMSIPPPPPPEPPKMEIKAEPAAKPVKPTPKEEPKAAAKEPESSKGKLALSNFFRSKTNKVALPQPAVEVEVQPVVEVQETPVEVPEPVVVEVKQMVEEIPQLVVEAEKVDSSKAGTLEAAAKPEPPPPVQEAKKTAPKSPFFSLFKSKAADPKKATPAPAAAVDTVKAKEEPKAAAKSSEAVVDNKPASVASKTGGDATNAPKKQEKRSFFKILGQKRNSTDAGIQTEPVTVAPAAEKAK
ncbi:breast carcinoma-amplified sequence 1 isoform X1 [Cyclopterus lumpus]|uniref:breast carcinoma-amplified sequence 1 isoform X1 n=1 Tax=Cyclopterus lumpus TaxID=8103 RepID=UPI0014866CCF|nr:breast carcinoma-amplified sequence 1 isoform X1 [Cyclopterus lumpus]XP_034392414.1 breast carcinoma-amplified sequence 1 isoform X1 [Cyclopterus lumpus]